MNLSKAQILNKYKKYLSNPEVFSAPTNEEVLAIAFHVIGAVHQIESAIREGRLDGKTPQPDKEYESKQTTLNRFNQYAKEIKAGVISDVSKIEQELKKAVDDAIAKIENGNDGVVTDAEIARAAELAFDMLEIPDFESLVQEQITANPMAVRDSLELISEEKDKLSQDAVQNLREDLRQLQEQIARINLDVKGSVGTSKNVIDYMITQRIADGTIGSGSGVSIEVPTGTVNGSNTTFTVTNEPKYIVVNALTYFDGAGYEYSGGTITFDIPPTTGSTIKSIY